MVNQDADVIFDIEVVESFKGVSGKRVRLNRGSRHSSCYSGYTIGETYVIYASRTVSGGFFKDEGARPDTVFQGSFCNRTANVKGAQDQLMYIREKRRGMREPQVYGAVGRSDADQLNGDWRYAPLESVPVVLERADGKSFKVLTDKFGRYRFDDIPEGEYSLKPLPGPDYKLFYPDSESVRILSNRKIAYNHYGYEIEYDAFYGSFSVGWANGVLGRVVDRDGKSVHRYAIDLVPAALPDKEIQTYVPGSPDWYEERAFSTGRKPPGKYLLAVDIYAAFGSQRKKRFFYPQTERAAEAKVFDLLAGTTVQNLTFSLPFNVRWIRGEFFWSDGKAIPARNWVDVRRSQADKSEDPSFNWSPGENGRFKVQVLEGFQYWFFAEVFVDVLDTGRGTRISVKAKPQQITVGSSDVVLKVILEKPANLVNDKTR